MANTNTSNQALTADTITNDQIHELRCAVRDERGALDIVRTGYSEYLKFDIIENHCRVALGEKRADRGRTRAQSRERCAEILNERGLWKSLNACGPSVAGDITCACGDIHPVESTEAK